MPTNRVCQRVGCEEEGIWIACLRFQPEPGSKRDDVCQTGSTITLCHQHKNNFKVEDIVSDAVFGRVSELMRHMEMKAPKKEHTVLFLMPTDDPNLN